jgi:3-oxoacyl-[acyl-carrier-protein] synthase-3
MAYGIVSMGHAIGVPASVADVAAEYTTDLRKLRGWQYQRLHRAEAGTGLTDLAAQAGTLALQRAGIAATDVDLIVLAIADIPEYLYWDPAAALQGRLNAYQAEAVLINQACSSGVLSFDAVAGKLATHPDYQVALVLGAHRVCEVYWNRMASNTSVTSDGAAAAVVVRDHPACRWLTTEVITDGRYADLARLATGGAARPFCPENPTIAPVPSPVDKLESHFRGDVEAMFTFSTATVTRIRDVLERACKRAGVPIDEVRRVIHLHDNARTFRQLAKELTIPLEHTNVGLAMEHGHFGCADQLYGLEQLLASGEVGSGDVVALTAMGSGMHWACTLLRM